MKTLLLLPILFADIVPVPPSRTTQESDPRDADLASMQGSWDVISWKMLAPFGGTLRREGLHAQIERHRLVFFRDDKAEEDWRIRLDPTKSPLHFDIEPKGTNRRQPGVYKLDCNKLIIRVETADCARPKTVEKDGQGLACLYLVLQRPRQ
jgi:uncharacterized protein (TIGR03067 family)